MRNSYYLVEPEVAGGWGPATVVAEPRTHPPEILELEYEFFGWLGDPLVTSFPVYLATRSLLAELARLGATGYRVAEATITRNEQFDEVQPETVLPPFAWLRPTGIPGFDDLGALPNADLIVSERVYELLLAAGMNYAEVSRWPDLVE